MFRLFVVVALLLASVSARPAQACTPSRPSARVRVSFLADSDLTALVKWAKQTTCVEYSFEHSLGQRRLAQPVILSVTGRDAEPILEILVHTMNLKLQGRGAKRSIVADGPESPESRESNDRDRTEVEREKVLANLEAEIKRQDESHYTITRRGADAITSHLSGLARTVRVTPEARDGKPVGYRLAGVRPTGPLSRVGLQNGDVVLSLNGNALTSPDKALEAYTKFRKTGVIEAAYVRDNQPMTVELRVAE